MSDRRVFGWWVRWIALMAGVAAIVGAAAAWAAPAEAQEGEAPDRLNHAGLVIRHGDGRVTYAYVAFEGEELNGIELLRHSGIEAVTIPFGGLGEGVCSLEGEGCGVVDCRRVCQTGGRDSPYWRYFGLDDAGLWRPFELGASSATVRDGDVQLWSWSPDDPGIGRIALTEVARLAGVPEGPSEAERWVRTVYPAGTGPEGDDGQPWPIYAAAGGVLVVIGAGAAYAVRRGRTETGRRG